MSSGIDAVGGPVAAIAIGFCALVAVFAAVAAINGCNRRNAAAQQPNGEPQTGTSSGEKDVDIEVGEVAAETVVQVQGCCFGGGGDGGGGCGGD